MPQRWLLQERHAVRGQGGQGGPHQVLLGAPGEFIDPPAGHDEVQGRVQGWRGAEGGGPGLDLHLGRQELVLAQLFN